MKAVYRSVPRPGSNAAFTSSGHQASRVRTASAWVYFFEPADVSVRRPPAAIHASSRSTAVFAAGSVTGADSITFSRSGTTSSARRSARPASAIAFTSAARVTPPSATSFFTRSSSRLPRCTEPLPQGAVV